MNEQGLEEWVDSLAAGEASMSERNLKWVEANGGREKLVQAARARGVHLLQLTDDKGNKLVAASAEAFETLC